MAREWVDPDDAPEWTDEMFDAAEFSIGGQVIRPPRGKLTADGVRYFTDAPAKTATAAAPRAVVDRVDAQGGVGGTKAMAGTTTSDKAAKSASKVLKDGRTGKNSKSAAGSALSQKEGKKK